MHGLLLKSQNMWLEKKKKKKSLKTRKEAKHGSRRESKPTLHVRFCFLYGTSVGCTCSPLVRKLI